MKDFKTLFRALHSSINDLTVLQTMLTATRSKNRLAIEEASIAIADALYRNRAGYAISAARALLLLAGPDKAITRMKRDGLLRASSQGFVSGAITKLIDDWLTNANLYSLSAVDLRYLTSTAALLTLAPTLHKLHVSMLSRLREDRTFALKSLLAEIDTIFTYPVSEPPVFDPIQTKPFSIEELAEGFSYLLGLFHRQFGLKAENIVVTALDLGYTSRYRDLLTDAAMVCRYMEAEVLLEGFPYQAEIESSGVRVFSVDPAVERSIRIGYIQMELQSEINRHRLNVARDGAFHEASLQVFATNFFTQFGNHVAKLKTRPVTRYTLEIKMLPPMASLFADDRSFIEEISSMEGIAWEEYITPEEVPDALVSGGITVRDVLKVQRLLGFMHFGLDQAIAKHLPSERPGLYMASCLPVVRRALLVKHLAIAVGEMKAEEMLALLTADPASPNLDIQYAPIIVAGDYAVLSLSVASRSNLVRNLLCRLRRRLGVSRNEDPMQMALANSLRNAGFALEVEIYLTGKKLEVDILAYREGVLLVFECKNAYSPCNVYEMRNTFEAIKHAAEQLELRMEWLNNIANQRALFARLGWPLPAQPLSMHTCIALGNRVFNGYMCGGHPVRQVHEMLNVLDSGYIELDEGRVRVWERESFSPADLVSYLQGSVIHSEFVQALSPYQNVTEYGNKSLTQPSYLINLLALKELVLARYPLMPATEMENVAQ
jgi:hypothetical protein